MKKHTFAPMTTIRNYFIKVMLCWVLFANGFTSLHAQDNKKPAPAQVSYVGIVDDKIVFQVDYNNEGVAPFLLSIKDQQGFDFFVSRYKDKKFKKYFAFDKSEVLNNTITFVIDERGSQQSQSFNISFNLRQSEEVSIVKQ